MLRNDNNFVFESDDCIKTLTITIAGKEYNYEQGSIKLSEGLNSSSLLDFKNTEGSSIKFNIIDFENNVKGIQGNPMIVTLKGELNGYSQTIRIGTFTCEEPVKVDDTRVEVIGYDYMKKFDIDVSSWWNSLKFPISIRNLLISLCEHVGVDYIIEPTFTNSDYMIAARENSTINVIQEEIDNNWRSQHFGEVTQEEQIITTKTTSAPFTTNSLKGRELLGYINEVTASYWRVDRLGRIKQYSLFREAIYPADNIYPANDLFPIEDSDTRYGNDKIASTAVYDYTAPIVDKLVITSSENDVGVIVGEGTSAYRIENNPLLYTTSDSALRPYAQKIYDVLSTICFVPTHIDVKYLPFIEVGDKIGIKTPKGTVSTFYVFNRDVSNFPYGLETITCDSEKTREVHSGANKEFNRLYGLTHEIINTIEEWRSTITDWDKLLQSDIKQLSNSISLVVNKFGGSGNDKYVINSASIVLAINDDGGSRIQLTADTIDLDGVVKFINSKEGDGTFTTINGGTITTHTITAKEISTELFYAGWIYLNYDGTNSEAGIQFFEPNKNTFLKSDGTNFIFSVLGDVPFEISSDMSTHGYDAGSGVRIGNLWFMDIGAENITSSTGISPYETDMYQLGGTNNRWSKGRFTALYINENEVVPSDDHIGQTNLGTSSKPFNEVHADRVYANGTDLLAYISDLEDKIDDLQRQINNLGGVI